MEEQILPIGIDSEIEHIESEIDRVDAIFSVATGPIGHQGINYHIIDEERDFRTTPQSLIHAPSIPESPQEESSSKSRVSPLECRHTADFSDSKVFNGLQEDRVSTEWVQDKISDNYDRKARFSLPEIDGSNQRIKKYQIKKMNNSLKHIQKEQFISSPITNIDKEQEEEEEQRQKSSFFLNESTLEIPEHCRPNLNNTLQQQAETLLPFYTINELAQHSDSTDAWICIFGHIYDVTALIKKAHGTTIYRQFIDYAGQDISSWFDEQTHEPRKRVDPQTHEPVSLIKNLSEIEAFGSPFWKTEEFLIGRLTEHSRYIRLVHHFSPKHPYVLEIAEEETIGQIAKRFLKYNSHIFSYTWRYNDHVLDFNKTLRENGIPNEESFHDKYGWRSDSENCPTILLFFTDDLTIA